MVKRGHAYQCDFTTKQWEEMDINKYGSAGCGHPFCMICWMRYVDTKINEGPYKCLTLRCPEPFCGAAVDGDMVHKLASESSMKSFCWRCGEEAHRPVDCETAHQWITKNKSKS
ncbi:Zinc finger, CCHC-type [Sesbania bispinosa]|nr:Zinc finger, CCHC-type [Sesbania bispinosa]